MRSLVMLVVLGTLFATPAAFALGTTSASLGDTVWLETINVNGIQDPGEPGIPNVIVTAKRYDAAGNLIYDQSKTTDANGYYLFPVLNPGTYTVSTNVTAYDPTYDLDGIATPNTTQAVLAAGQAKRDVDFGYKLPPVGSIGDYVWLDSDRDAEQDTDEFGIPNVTVSLLDSAGAVLATTTTDANGLYTFGGLKAGDYSVAVDYSTISPADLELSYDLDGIGTPNIAAASLGYGENRTDVDFGYKPLLLGSIGDYVWFDADGDAQQDAGEVGIPGVSVELYQDNTLVATTTTDGGGLYIFGCLKAGTYTVKVVASTLPSDLTIQTYDLDGLTTANEATASLAAGEDRRDVDFGYTKETDDRPYQTQTQGGWGGKPSGDNPGAMLHANFATVYPEGLRVGSNHWLQFDDPQEITDFLPQGGTAGTLINNYDPPKKRTEAGVFAGQVLALRLNVDFSAAGYTRSGLGSLVIQTGTFEGWSVDELLSFCEQVLGGNSDELQYSLSDLNDAATNVNENYVDGTTDKGYLAPATQ